MISLQVLQAIFLTIWSQRIQSDVAM